MAAVDGVTQMSDKEELAELTELLHRRNEFDYDECDHGFYHGPLEGQPYAMCDRVARGLLESDWLRRVRAGAAAEARAEIQAAIDNSNPFGLWEIAALSNVRKILESYRGSTPMEGTKQ